MKKDDQNKVYDLEERTEAFAKEIRALLVKVPVNPVSEPDIKQLVRSSRSVAANYIEANEAVSPKDFALRIKYCRKESKESGLCLRLLKPSVPKSLQEKSVTLERESQELTKIFGSIHRKTKA